MPKVTLSIVFRSLPAIMGVSATHNLEMNSVAMSRKPGEKVGCICSLNQKEKKLLINVEYNQLERVFTDGEPLNASGYSKYPGNTNTLVFSIPEYLDTLKRTQGLIAEFINPKMNADGSFKSSTRLECMM